MYVARGLSRLLGDAIAALPHDGPMPEVDKGRVLWVFPVYSWGVPPVVADIVKTIDIPGAEGARHMVVMTCGDDVGRTDRQWRKLIRSRGWTDGDAWSVQMPNTYVLMKGFDVDSDKLAMAKIKASEERVRRIAELIGSRATPASGDVITDVVSGGFAWTKSAVVYPWFIRHAMSPKPFHSTDSCTGCGLCSRSCPMDNIAMADRRPVWGAECALCLRCYHICPSHAVGYSNATYGKGQKKQLLEFVKPDIDI